MSNPDRTIQVVPHELKRRALTVKKIEMVTPQIKRITFTGSDLNDFQSLSPDDHIKVFIPGSSEMRDYTPMRFDREALELDLEFVLHGKGPGSRWAQEAKVGESLSIGGPRGSKIVPYNFDWYLIIGDETFIPSITRRLLELPKGAKAIVMIEVEDQSHEALLSHHEGVELHWVHRHGAKAGSPEKMIQKLQSMVLPEGDYFTWIGCEKKSASELKHFILEQKNGHGEWMKATGYWGNRH